MHDVVMANRARKTDQEVQAALLSTSGDVKAAAALLGISRQALHERLARKAHLRAEPRLDRATINKIVASMQMLDVGLDLGEWWAITAMLDSEWKGKPRRPVRPRFSDEEVEDLILSLGGDLELYWATKEKITPPGKPTLKQRRIAVEIAAAVALKIPCNQVWRRLKQAWVVLPIRDLIQTELDRRISATMYETPA